MNLILAAAPLNNDATLAQILRNLPTGTFDSAATARTLQVIADIPDIALPADTFAKKLGLFLRHHCGEAAGDLVLPGADSVSLETTTCDVRRMDIHNYRSGAWRKVDAIRFRLLRRGLVHFKLRHMFEHFDFTDLKDLNSFWPPRTDLQEELTFQIAAQTAETKLVGPVDLADGFVSYPNVAFDGCQYRVGVTWTASPEGSRAQPIARLDQFFLTAGPGDRVIPIARAELTHIANILSLCGRLNNWVFSGEP